MRRLAQFVRLLASRVCLFASVSRLLMLRVPNARVCVCLASAHVKGSECSRLRLCASVHVKGSECVRLRLCASVCVCSRLCASTSVCLRLSACVYVRLSRVCLFASVCPC